MTKSKYDTIGNPFHADFNTGLSDGGDFNAIARHGDRTGEALAAYLDGYALGGECMAVYLDEQED